MNSRFPLRVHPLRSEWQIGRPVQDWNDDPQRTHAEVVSVFDAAIAALETNSG